MKPSQLNDRQKRMILQYELPDSVLGERFGMSRHHVSVVRKQLKAALLQPVGYIETATGEELDAVAHNVKRAWGESDQAFRQRILDLEIAQDERT